MKKSLISILVLLSLVAASCGDDDDDTGDATAANETENIDVEAIAIGTYPIWLTVPDYVALEEGFFEQVGLDAELIGFASGPEQIAALASNSIDVMSNTAANVVIGNAAGQDFVVLAGATPGTPYTLVAQNDWPTPNEGKGYPAVAEDLRGAIIGVSALGAETELFVRRMMQDAGLDPDRDATFVAVGQGQQSLAAFQTGQVDLLMAVEVTQTLILDVEKSGKKVVEMRAGYPDVPELFEDFATNVRATLRSQAESNGEVMSRYLEAYSLAHEFIQDPANKERVLEIYSHYIELDPEVMELIYDNNVATLDPIFNCLALEKIFTFEIENGLMEEGDTLSCKEFMWEGAEAYAKNM